MGILNDAKYGKTTRDELLKDYYYSTEAWEAQLKERIKTVDYYDPEIETTADYQTKKEMEYYDTLEKISNIKNITPKNAHSIVQAKKLIRNNFQRRF